jgi:hypothetical protein
MKNSYLWIRGGAFADLVGDKPANEFCKELVGYRNKVRDAINKGTVCCDGYKTFIAIQPVRVYHFTENTASQRFANRNENYKTGSGKPFFALQFQRATEAMNWKLAATDICIENVDAKEARTRGEDYLELKNDSAEFFLQHDKKDKMQIEALSTEWKVGLFTGKLRSSKENQKHFRSSDDQKLLQYADIPAL